MRVADAVRATSGVHRLRVGEKFIDADGDWEVTRLPEVVGNEVIVYCRPYPGHEGQRSRAYVYPKGTQVRMLRK